MDPDTGVMLLIKICEAVIKSNIRSVLAIRKRTHMLWNTDSGSASIGFTHRTREIKIAQYPLSGNVTI
jgi:hypothetical protein